MTKLGKTTIIIVIVALLALNLHAQLVPKSQKNEQITIQSPLIGIAVLKPDKPSNTIIVFRAHANGTMETLRLEESQFKNTPLQQWAPLKLKEPKPQPPTSPTFPRQR